MRLGGPLFGVTNSPEEWVETVKDHGYRASYCPIGYDAEDHEIQAYRRAAKKADIVIAEVGAWSNPISPNQQIRREAVEKCKRSLQLADEIGAKCAVNIAGSRGEKWDGPDSSDLTTDTFDLIVETVRDIIDTVNPQRSFYCLETMPWMYPDSTDSYVELLKAIDRKGCAAHLDPVNLICSPQRYFNNGSLIKECFAKLGPYIKSCHAKDILLHDQLTTHLDEVQPGKGRLDYTIYLRELSKLDHDTPLMMEHLHSEEEYREAA
ncbi:TPA: sugar phosphate isomerase/epimerase, partial [Candidatus Poribacteria bacterium]|nr:sugar phosphate isomerase/epimerase [Candidatus Poribacteria bacterium]